MTTTSYNIYQQLTSVRLSSTANLAGKYFNGSLNNGVGATLVANSVGVLIIDGIPVNIGDRLLLKDQTATNQNGIYVVKAKGGPISFWLIERAPDVQSLEQLKIGQYFSVGAGSTLAGAMFVIAEPLPSVIGVDSFNFIDVANSGSTIGPYLRKDQNLADVNSVPSTLANIGQGNGETIEIGDSDFSGGIYQIINPFPKELFVTVGTPGLEVRLPVANELTSPAIGQGVFINNFGSTESIEVAYSDGSLLQSIDRNGKFFFSLQDKSTSVGIYTGESQVDIVNGKNGIVILNSSDIDVDPNFTPTNYTPVSGSEYSEQSITGNLAGINNALSGLPPSVQDFQNTYNSGDNAIINMNSSRPVIFQTYSQITGVNAILFQGTGTTISPVYRLIGFKFIPVIDMLVTALQYDDNMMISSTYGHDTGIYNFNTFQLLCRATIYKTDPLDTTSVYRTKTISSPTLLTAGTPYVFATVQNINEPTYTNKNVTPNSNIVLSELAQLPSSSTGVSLQFPQTFTPSTPNQIYLGSFVYQGLTVNESININDGSTNTNTIFSVESTARGSIPAPKMTLANFNSITSKPIGLTAYSTDLFRPVIYTAQGPYKPVAYLSDITLQAEGGLYGITLDVANTNNATFINIIYSSFQRIENKVTVTARITFVPTSTSPVISILTLFNIVSFADDAQASGLGNLWLTTSPTVSDGSAQVHSNSGSSSVAVNMLTPGADSVKSYELNVIYSYTINPNIFLNPFITVWNTEASTPGSMYLELPLSSSGTYNMIVDWGDGTFNRVIAYNDNYNHTYASPGIYTVKIYGTCNGFGYNTTPYGDTNQLIDILQWGNVQLDDGTTTGGYFAYTANLLNISAADAPNLSSTTTLGIAFFNSGITNINNLSGWDTSTITNMTSCFQNTPNFIGNGIGSWNTSAVTSMQSMFQNSPSFNPSEGVLNWDVSSLISANQMFAQASTFNCSLPWTTTTSLIDTTNMFQQAVSFIGTGLENWITTNVTNMHNMFDGNGLTMAFNGIITNWDVSNVTDMTQMFTHCDSFNRPLNWDTSSCTNMFQMFVDCISFNQDLPNFVTSTCTNVTNILSRCSAFNGQINTWDLTGITSGGFGGGLWEMVSDCTSFNQSVAGLNPINAGGYVRTFGGCTALDQDFSSWPISNITDASQMFDGVTLSNANYNKLLVAWAAGSPQSGVTFSGGNSHYDSTSGGVDGVAARAVLTGTYGWSITDGGTP